MADTATHSGAMKLNIQKGALHKQLGVPQGQKIPTSTLQRLKNSGDAKTRQRANFALVARKWAKGGRKGK